MSNYKATNIFLFQWEITWNYHSYILVNYIYCKACLQNNFMYVVINLIIVLYPIWNYCALDKAVCKISMLHNKFSDCAIPHTRISQLWYNRLKILCDSVGWKWLAYQSCGIRLKHLCNYYTRWKLFAYQMNIVH